MATASSMIFRALQMTGEKTRGGSLTATEKTECLDALNSMMESWSLERLLIYQLLQESFALTTSDGSYTIGSGADFNTTRPVKIVDPCFIRDADNFDTELQIIDADTYGKIAGKTSGNSYPEYLFYDGGYSTTSTATIKLYPEPSASLTLFINSLKQLQTFSTISVTVMLPPGYQRAIESNLAIELAAGVVSVPPEVIKIARESKAVIKGINLPTGVLSIDPAIQAVGARNILMGP